MMNDYGGMMGGFDSMFTLFMILFFCAFVFVIVKGLMEWNSNHQSPRLNVSARIVSKRQDVTVHHHANAVDFSGAHGYHTSTTTKYYVTFKVESGDRMEFHVSGCEYGRLAEGDHGQLMFQGTRYLGFDIIQEQR